ncbi:hypothetical protein Poly30_53460 [Planctomycetes bacterium Poly30]|uniref:Pectate lyase superfamily protein n=1 Tax=Saltatorellus ferox TaxID=2528018 RepID=A0A518F0B8_9BACT|nr:hypothetical protein Poly30_53460 [Planctomycetes bacterium Poly30]
MRILFPALLVALATLSFADSTTQYDPSWASAPATSTIALDHDGALTDEQNGAIFKAAVSQLQPGDRLVVGDGTWSVDSLFQVSLVGTANAPIRIEAAPGAKPVLTRPDANRPSAPSAGAFEVGTYGRYTGTGTPSVNGQPRITSSGLPSVTSGPIQVNLEEAQGGVLAILFFYKSAGAAGPSFPAQRTILATDVHGDASTLLDIPSDPVFAGVTFDALWVARDAGAANGRSQTQIVRWTL